MAILFDLDGTLLDTAADFYTAVSELCLELNKPLIEYTLLRNLVSEGTNAILKFGLNLAAAEDSVDFINIKQKFLTYYKNTAFKGTKPFIEIPEILALIEQHSIPWGVVTNKPGYLTMPLMESLQLDKRASCIVSGDTTPYAKPHPAPLLHACKLLQVNPKDCVYIGDARRDIDAGNSADMLTITAMYGYIQDLQEAKTWPAKHAVENTFELKQWIKTWLAKK